MSADPDRWDLVVLGSGPAGQKAAIQGAKLGKRVLVVEQESALGGHCVHRGAIPSKALRESALALSAIRRRCGESFSVTGRDALGLAELMERVDRVVAAHEKFVSAQLMRGGVDRWHGRARFVGPHLVEVEGVDRKRRWARGDVIVIATGSRPRASEDVPVDHEHVFDSDSILSMTYLPRSLTVLGGGVIACEYASIFQALGVQVLMLDEGERPLSFLDPDLSDRFIAGFKRMGGRILSGQRVASIEWDGVSQVTTRVESGISVQSQKLLCARGRVANVEGLRLDAVGLATDARGALAVDEHLRTAIPHVYAVGDAAGPPGLASTATDQGRRAVAHAFGLPVGSAPEIVPMTVHALPEIASVGLDEAQAIDRYGGVVVGRAHLDEVARGQIMGVDDGLLKMVADPAGHRLLGVQIVGEGACELIHVAQVALLGGLSVDAFVENVFGFAALAEAYRVAALDVVKLRPEHRPATTSPPVRRPSGGAALLRDFR